jgi:septal ring factor EnvC (AmiA/AmiB activator)
MDILDNADLSQKALDIVESLEGQIKTLEDELNQTREALAKERNRLRWSDRSNDKLRSELQEQKDMRKTERQGLAAWLDRRIKQQEEALLAKFVSQETKRVVEIEVSLLKRYREIIVNGEQRNEDPLMPKFA